APTDGSAWVPSTRLAAFLQGTEASRRAARGGSWDAYPQYLRAASRGRLSTGNRDSWGSRVGGRLPLNSSPHYLVGPGGDALGRNRIGGWAMPDQSIHDGYSKRMILVKPSFA